MSSHLKEHALFQILLTGFSRERPLPTGGYEGACWVGCSSSDLGWRDSSNVDAERFHQLRSAVEKSVGIVGSKGCRYLLQQQGILESLVAKAVVFLLLFFSPARGHCGQGDPFRCLSAGIHNDNTRVQGLSMCMALLEQVGRVQVQLQK